MKQCMDTDNLHRRLKKIEGQVAAIDRMIEEDGVSPLELSTVFIVSEWTEYTAYEVL